MKETREAISAVANDDGALAELCLTERHGDETPWCGGPCPLWLTGKLSYDLGGRNQAPRARQFETFFCQHRLCQVGSLSAGQIPVLGLQDRFLSFTVGAGAQGSGSSTSVTGVRVGLSIGVWVHHLDDAFATFGRHTGDKHSEGMFAAAALLESYLRQIQSIEGNLREADENIDTVREVPAAAYRQTLHCILLYCAAVPHAVGLLAHRTRDCLHNGPCFLCSRLRP